ncbi:MAG: sigma D regulator [Pseudomonadales bacterium]|nr:sigma D regulator [Pseudomonadales bacterium]
MTQNTTSGTPGTGRKSKKSNTQNSHHVKVLDHSVIGFLDDRQRLIVQIMKLSSAIDARHHDIVEALTIRLCQQMVDYLSNGHFHIYSELFPNKNALIDLDATTQMGMRFHDEFVGQAGLLKINFDILKTSLERLTLALETRFELEDLMINQSKNMSLSA